MQKKQRKFQLKTKIMDTSSTEATETIITLMQKANFFKTLKQDHKKESLFTAEIKVSGYIDLIGIISDLLKASILALDSEPPYVSGSIFNPEINVMTLLEIALQLLPLGEIELLDALHKLHLKQEQEVNSEK